MDFMESVKRELEYQKHLYRSFNKLRKNMDKGRLSCTVRPGGQKRYYITDESGRKYVHMKCPAEVQRLHRVQMKEIGEIVAKRLEENIRLLTDLIKGYDGSDIYEIMAALPERLKIGDLADGIWKHAGGQQITVQSEKPTRREELKHTTSFGLRTRSKNEALLAEILHAAGIEFYYERKLVLIDEFGREIAIYPDFTIITASGEAIYWEHKGMMADTEYCEMDKERMRLYFLNGIFQPYNLIVTTDGPKGVFCGVEIGAMVEKILMPLCKSRF